MPILVLVRGLPYSGKTTYAKENFAAHGFSHLETDMYFTKDGKYKYEPGKAHLAVDWCQRETLSLMQNAKDIVVSNHFTKHWEMGYYLDKAIKYGYDIIVHTCSLQFDANGKYPQRLVNYMTANFEH